MGGYDEDGVGDNFDSFPEDGTKTIDTDTFIPEFSDKKEHLSAWFVINETGALMKNNNEQVRRWVDWSGSKYHFKQGNKSLRPSFNESEQALEFSGGEHMVLNRSKPTEKTIFIVSKGVGPVFGDSSTFVTPTIGNVNLGVGSRASWARDIKSSTLKFEDKSIYVYTDDGVTVGFSYGRNKLHEGKHYGRENPDSKIYLGKTGVTNSAHFTGYVYEVIIFEKVMTEAEVNEIHDYLSNKWDIETSLSTEVEVDVSSALEGIGTTKRPYRGIFKAMKRLRRGGRLRIRKGRYPEPLSVTQSTIIEAKDGEVILGTPKNEQ